MVVIEPDLNSTGVLEPNAVNVSWSTELPCHAIVTMVTACLFTQISDMYCEVDGKKDIVLRKQKSKKYVDVVYIDVYVGTDLELRPGRNY